MMTTKSVPVSRRTSSANGSSRAVGSEDSTPRRTNGESATERATAVACARALSRVSRRASQAARATAVTTVSGLLGTPPPWPVGLVTAVIAGILLWSVTARLRLRPESRAAATAVYACCALLTELTTADGVDGRATLLLAAGGMFAAAGKRRSALAALPAFSTRGAQRHLPVWWSAAQRAASLPDSELPAMSALHDGPPPARSWQGLDPRAAERLSACRTALQEIAERHRLPVENLLTPDTLRRLVWEPPAEPTPETVAEGLRSRGAREWQIELTAERLAGILREAE